METMKKTVTINNRTLLRGYRHYRQRLLSGEIDRVIIPVNGKKLCLSVLPEKSKPRPGDIRPLLEKLKAMGPKRRISLVRIEWDMKYQKLMKRLWRKRKNNNRHA